jgi:TRAP-type C4-dicarboxylate transport system permease small subunit
LIGRAGHSWLSRLERIGRALETWLVVLLLGGLIALSSLQILLRNLFSIGFTWTDGLIRLIVLWLALVGALAASREGRHITMNALTRWLPPRLATIAAICADLVAMLVSGSLAWFAWAFVGDSREFGDTLLGDVPAWWLQSPMPVLFALIAIEFARSAVRRLFPPVPQSEDV